jgi:hypothetical protein
MEEAVARFDALLERVCQELRAGCELSPDHILVDLHFVHQIV